MSRRNNCAKCPFLIRLYGHRPMKGQDEYIHTCYILKGSNGAKYHNYYIVRGNSEVGLVSYDLIVIMKFMALTAGRFGHETSN